NKIVMYLAENPDKGKSAASNQHWGIEEYTIMLGYLENRDNWSLLFGEDKKTAVGKKYITASIAWDNFAQWFNKEANYDLNGKAMQQRVGR
ncbi:hypothetical protein BGZ74_006571, partial [Mortierella antarctica]